jgi:hypothetical protein
MITRASRTRSVRSRHTTSGPQLNNLKRAVQQLGEHTIDGRTSIGKALARWRTDLINDLGGQVSTQELAVIDLAVKTKLLLDSADAWLLSQPSLVNARQRRLVAAVLQRQRLADALARYLALLGLKRRQAPAPSLDAYLSAGQETDEADAGAEPT